MEINTEKYGTTGLPRFGGGVASGETSGAALTDINNAFNGLVNTVKKHAAPGNDSALWFFGMVLQTVYGAALYCITGKPVING